MNSDCSVPAPRLLYVGTYTGKSSQGIYLYQFDPRSGALVSLGLAAESANPSFLALHPSRRFLYAANEVSDFAGQPSGAVTAFAIDPPTGGLTPINQQPTGGTDPCHLAVNRAGTHLFVANYSSGSIAVFPLTPDGKIGSATSFIQHHGSSINPGRQKGPHAHGTHLHADDRLVFVPDLGLDKILLYRFSEQSGTLVPLDTASATLDPGAGPRHVAFHPTGHFAYVINELHSTITTLPLTADGTPAKPIQTLSTLPADFSGKSFTAEIAVHPNGKFLYGSNRGHESIAVFAIDAATGALTFVQHALTQGKEPRHFTIDPSGQWLLAANQNSNTILVFRINAQTGQLTPASPPIEAPCPVCLQWLAQP